MVEKKPIWKKFLKFIKQASIIGTLTVVLFELCFRLYLLDFYGQDFEYLNSNFKKKETTKSLVVIGDSFSAFKEGYPQVFYDSLFEFRVRNFSVPGTSIREQYLFGKHHIHQENPDILVFQFYVGNDLFSWNHPQVKDSISFMRNAYWQLSEYFWSLSFVNHRLGSFNVNTAKKELEKSLNREFDPKLFSPRDGIYFEAEPMLVDNAAMLRGGRFKDLQSYMKRMKQLFEYANEQCSVYVLVIPHAAQVNETYLDRTKQLGAEFSSDFQSGLDHYPLFDEMIEFFSEDKRVRVLNPIGMLKEVEEKGERVYYINDSHLTLKGQQAIGYYLLKQFENQMDELPPLMPIP